MPAPAAASAFIRETANGTSSARRARPGGRRAPEPGRRLGPVPRTGPAPTSGPRPGPGRSQRAQQPDASSADPGGPARRGRAARPGSRRPPAAASASSDRLPPTGRPAGPGRRPRRRRGRRRPDPGVRRAGSRRGCCPGRPLTSAAAASVQPAVPGRPREPVQVAGPGPPAWPARASRSAGEPAWSWRVRRPCWSKVIGEPVSGRPRARPPPTGSRARPRRRPRRPRRRAAAPADSGPAWPNRVASIAAVRTAPRPGRRIAPATRHPGQVLGDFSSGGRGRRPQSPVPAAAVVLRGKPGRDVDHADPSRARSTPSGRLPQPARRPSGRPAWIARASSRPAAVV